MQSPDWSVWPGTLGPRAEFCISSRKVILQGTISVPFSTSRPRGGSPSESLQPKLEEDPWNYIFCLILQSIGCFDKAFS